MSSSEAVNELMEVAAKVLLELCRLLRLPLRLSWKSGTEKGEISYELKLQQRHAGGRIVSTSIWVPGKCRLSSAETDF